VNRRYDRRPRWKAAVLQTAALTPVTKLVMLVLLDHMSADGKVQYAVADVTRDLGYRNARRITDRITEAHRAGFLTTVQKAVHGRVAQYQATIPSDPESGSLEVPVNGVTGNGVTRRGNARNGVTSITRSPHLASPQRAATRNARGCDMCEDYGCAACIPDASEAS
jgi:hypothetical protein